MSSKEHIEKSSFRYPAKQNNTLDLALKQDELCWFRVYTEKSIATLNAMLIPEDNNSEKKKIPNGEMSTFSVERIIVYEREW